MEARFCSACAAPLVTRVPEGDHLPRRVCPACGTVHYENPRVVVGCIAEYEGRLLLCRRAIEPRRGFWTLPAGFLENEETMADGAARECQEEALADVDIRNLLLIANVLPAHQIHVFYRATVRGGKFGAGPESLESMLVDPADIPWDELAFPSSRTAIELWLADRKAGTEGLHELTLSRRFETGAEVSSGRSPVQNTRPPEPAGARDPKDPT
jgi:ADP-ribose pyrophosphatase YjhB (NUDIX family)